MLVPKVQQMRALNVPYVLEYLEEKFDDAILMINEGCVFYGGAIRDILAGLEIGGDLDIAVPKIHNHNLLEQFNNSARWVNSKNLATPGGSAFPTTTEKIISGVYSYRNSSGVDIQLISPYEDGINSDEINGISIPVLNIVSNVDIICCGVLSDIFGNVYEVVPGAYDDCKQRVLNFNKNIRINENSLILLNSRIKKLVKRGWTNNIDLNKITINKNKE